MYKYSSVVSIEDTVEACEAVAFQIVFKENKPFKIIDCYFEIKNNHDFEIDESDYVTVLYFSKDKNLNVAKEKIRRAIELFIFLTGIPFAVNSSVVETVGDDIPAIDVNHSKKKMHDLEECNRIYGRVRKKRCLLENALKLYAVAIKEDFLLNENKENALFTYFKIIEIIVKDEFSVEKNNINKGQDCTKKYIKQMLNNVYGIETQENRLDDLEGTIRQTVFEQTFDNMYHKIMWFFKRKNILVNKNVVSNIVSLRNDIAHGESVIINEEMDEYKDVAFLARKTIEAKFFGKKTGIDCRQIVL